MRIAFVDNLHVGGGLSRFCLKLCKTLVENFPNLEVDYYVHESNLLQIPEIAILNTRVKVIILNTTRNRSKISLFVNRIFIYLFKTNLYSRDTNKEIENRIGYQYSLAYFPSAHMMKAPSLKIPFVGTWHDFNWKYFFGSEIFSNEFTYMMHSQVEKWFDNGYCITSSKFVLEEAKKMYPSLKRYPVVIPITQVVVNPKIDSKIANEILDSLEITYPYIIFPGHFYPHKNHLNLFSAFYLLKQKPAFKNYKLILTGVNTDKIERGISTYHGVRKVLKSEKEFDVVGVGYKSNEIIDVLIKNASLLVSPSIYEAICTPAMDAWSYATPTAISDIPAFREHESTWKVKSAFFDPMNPQNIADVIESYLLNYSKAKEDALFSRNQLAEYSWDTIASEYMEVFKKAINK
jgi:glycosyltransferase involved in cell wall biosynthesis